MLEGTSGAEVTWQASRAVGCELERYEVQQRAVGEAGSSGGGWPVCASGAAVQGQLSCRVGGLTAGTTYEFRVVAHAMGGAVPSAESEASSTLQIPGVLRKIASDAHDRPDTHHTHPQPSTCANCPLSHALWWQVWKPLQCRRSPLSRPPQPS